MANFVTNGSAVAPTASLPTLNFPKTDLNPVTGDATKYVAAADWNLVNQACYDLRGAILQGTLLGFSQQASRPAVSNASWYLWLDNVATPNLHFWDGTNDNIAAAVPATAKGDLAIYNGTNWVKLAVGTNTQVLTADSTQASGIKWAAGGGGGGIGGSIAANQVAFGSGANTIQGTSNFTYNGSSLSMTPTATGSGAVVPYFFAVPANTGATAGSEVQGFWISPANRQWNTGALATQREVLITAPTISFVGASTVTQAATLAITSPPLAGANATITNAYALWLQAGNLAMAPGTSLLSASQGATNTTGLTILTNVASGSSSVGLVIDNTTSFPSAGGTYLDLRNAGTSVFKIFNDSFGAPRFLNPTGTGFSVSGATGYLMGSSTYAVSWNSSVLQSYTDASTSLGTSSTRWSATYSRAYYSVSQAPTFGATMNIDPSLGEQVSVTLTANLGAWTISAPTAPGQRFQLTFIQDGTGSRTIGTPPAAIKWLPSTYLGTNHTAPTLTTAANAKDVFFFVTYDGANWVEVNRNMNN